jgi:deazaflavin-dependent oxidoreductase (nitroreductase family)
MELPAPRESTFWARALPAMYSVIGFLDPLIRREWRSTGIGLGNVVELRVVGRRTGQYRSVLLTLLRDDERWFLGHPNGDVAWTLNLEAAGTADLKFPRRVPIPIRARRLQGAERDVAMRLFDQHPFPGNLVYRAAQAHIRAVGVYFALDRVG